MDAIRASIDLSVVENAHRVNISKILLVELASRKALNEGLRSFGAQMKSVNDALNSVESIRTGKVSAAGFGIETDFQTQSKKEKDLNQSRLRVSSSRLGPQARTDVEAGIRLEDLRKSLTDLNARIQGEQATGKVAPEDIKRRKADIDALVDQSGGSKSFGAGNSAVAEFVEISKKALDLGGIEGGIGALNEKSQELSKKANELFDPSIKAFKEINSKRDRFQEELNKLFSKKLSIDVSNQSIASKQRAINDRVAKAEGKSGIVRANQSSNFRKAQALELLDVNGVKNNFAGKSQSATIEGIGNRLSTNQTRLTDLTTKSQGGVELTSAEIVERQKLIKESAVLTAALARLSDTTAQVAIEEEILTKLTKGRNTAESIANGFISGTDEQRRSQAKALSGAQFVSGGGNFSQIPEALRAAVIQQLEQAKGTNLKFAGGNSAEQVLGSIQRQTGFSSGLGQAQANVVDQEKKIAGLKIQGLSGQKIANNLEDQKRIKQGGLINDAQKGLESSEKFADGVGQAIVQMQLDGLKTFGSNLADTVNLLVGSKLDLVLQPVGINVNLNGADLLAKLPDVIQDTVFTKVAEAIEKFKLDQQNGAQ